MPVRFAPAARIIKTHGLSGEVVAAEQDDLPFIIEQDDVVSLVPPPAGPNTFTVTSVRPTPKGHLLAFEGVTDIDTASALVGCTILLPQERIERAQDNEESQSVIGLHVIDETHGDLGEIVDIIDTTVHDVWVVRGTWGEVLVPVIDDVVLGYEERAHSVRVALLDGLLPGTEDTAEGSMET